MSLWYQSDMIMWSALAILAVIIVGLMAGMLFLRKRIHRFEKASLSLQTFLSGNNLDEMLKEYTTEVHGLEQSLTALEARVQAVENKVRHSLDRAELVRYNAFENMGSDLSFALALLNQEGDGVILSSIHSREESRIYAKPLIKGESKYNLSKEEREVIMKGMARGKLSNEIKA